MIAIGCGGSPKSAASAPGGAASRLLERRGRRRCPRPGRRCLGCGPLPRRRRPAVVACSRVIRERSASAGPCRPPAHPFASNAVEATSLIDDAITSRANELDECVEAARTRRKSAHEKIVVEVGIDEEGHMLGVKLPKGGEADKALADCVLAALRGAPFPRSHAGVITVRKTFEDKAVYR